AIRTAGAVASSPGGLAARRPLRVVEASRRVRGQRSRTVSHAWRQIQLSRATLTARPLPPVASRDEWEAAREELLAAEREVLAKVREMAARRKALPMTRIEEDYSCEGPAGPAQLTDR